MLDMFLSGLVGWLIQELGGAAVRKAASDRVRTALTRVVEQAVPRAVRQVHADDDTRTHVVDLLLECPSRALPATDGNPLTELAAAVGVWVACVEHPVGDDGLPAAVDPAHPLVRPLCDEILAGIRYEAIYGAHVLDPLWSDYCRDAGADRLTTEIRAVRTGAAATPVPPPRIEYWHPPVGPTSGFIGRDGTLATLAGADRGVTVYGPGGAGKTALAVEHAGRVADRYPDGRVFVDFHSYAPDEHHPPKTAAEALAELLPRCGLERADVAAMDLRDRETAWRQAISGRRVLLVWDNVRDPAQVRPLLTGQPGCLTIVTSRTELDLPLDGVELGPLDARDAEKLFVAVAGADRCGDQAQVTDAAELCARMPLQIRVHAATVRRKRTLAELVVELRGMPAGRRLSDLFASLDLSYRYLSADERRALRALGVHLGPYLTAGTAAAMLDTPVEVAVRLLDGLVDANLADRYRGRFDRHGGGVEIPTDPAYYCYVVHDVVQEYAHHRAVAHTDEARENLRRKVEHYRRKTLPPVDPPWVQVERGCLVATLVQAPPGESRLGMALDVGGLLGELGWSSDAGEAFTVALWESMASRDLNSRAEALLGLSGCMAVAGMTVDSLVNAEAAAQIYRDLGDTRHGLQALQQMVVAMTSARNTDEAERCLDEALACARELDDRHTEATLRLHALDLAMLSRPDDPRHRRELGKLLWVARDLGLPRLEAQLLSRLAGQYLIHGSTKRAADTATRAVRLFRDLGDRHGQANATFALGEALHARGGHQQAIEHLHEALTLYREQGDVQGDIKTLTGLGETYLATGDLPRARDHLHAALDLARRRPDLSPVFAAGALNHLATVAHAGGDRDAACAHLREAIRLVTGAGYPADHLRRRLGAYLRATT